MALCYLKEHSSDFFSSHFLNILLAGSQETDERIVTVKIEAAGANIRSDVYVANVPQHPAAVHYGSIAAAGDCVSTDSMTRAFLSEI